MRGLSVDRRKESRDAEAGERSLTQAPAPSSLSPSAKGAGARKPAGPAKLKRRRRFRRIRITLTLILVLAILGTAGYYEVFQPYWRPTLQAGETFGIDVSNHQGAIDWHQVAQHKVSFAYLKATEGNDFVDKQFAVNWSEATKAGIPHGAYHFFTLCSSGAEQAANFLNVVPDDPTALPPVVDVEFGTCAKRPAKTVVQGELTDFVTAVERRVHKPVTIYTVPSFTDYYPLIQTSSQPLWKRSIFDRPSGPWTIWQASDKARVRGVRGRVDLDVMRQP